MKGCKILFLLVSGIFSFAFIRKIIDSKTPFKRDATIVQNSQYISLSQTNWNINWSCLSTIYHHFCYSNHISIVLANLFNAHYLPFYNNLAINNYDSPEWSHHHRQWLRNVQGRSQWGIGPAIFLSFHCWSSQVPERNCRNGKQAVLYWRIGSFQTRSPCP